MEALDEAIKTYGAPKIFNSDQGSQFTSLAFTGQLKAVGVTISMDGRGLIWTISLLRGSIKQLWRSLKYEAVYLHEMSHGHVAKTVIGDWIDFYNHKRPHSALNGNTPDMA